MIDSLSLSISASNLPHDLLGRTSENIVTNNSTWFISPCMSWPLHDKTAPKSTPRGLESCTRHSKRTMGDEINGKNPHNFPHPKNARRSISDFCHGRNRGCCTASYWCYVVWWLILRTLNANSCIRIRQDRTIGEEATGNHSLKIDFPKRKGQFCLWF